MKTLYSVHVHVYIQFSDQMIVDYEYETRTSTRKFNDCKS